MTRRRREDTKALKKGREPGQFLPFPCVALQSAEMAKLSAHACKLLLDMLSQWRIGNNGYLCAAWSVMKNRGWRSKETLAKSLKELEESGWLIRTRQGGRNLCSLFAVTFLRIDDPHPGKPLDIGPTVGPLSYWRESAPLKIDSLAPPGVAKTA